MMCPKTVKTLEPTLKWWIHTRLVYIYAREDLDGLFLWYAIFTIKKTLFFDFWFGFVQFYFFFFRILCEFNRTTEHCVLWMVPKALKNSFGMNLLRNLNSMEIRILNTNANAKYLNGKFSRKILKKREKGRKKTWKPSNKMHTLNHLFDKNPESRQTISTSLSFG